MKRGERLYLGLAAIIVIGLVVMEARKPAPIDWTPNLSRYYRTPYGTELIYERLPDILPYGITTVHEGVYGTGRQREDRTGPVTHMFLQTTFRPDDLHLEALLEQVSAGDHAFIAAAELSMDMDSALGLLSARSEGLSNTLTIRFLQLPHEKRGFSMERTGLAGRFSDLEPHITTLAVNGSSEPVFVHVPYGEGAFWLCSVPLAFTNYQLLRAPNDAFIATALAYLPAQPVLWDEHYKVGRLGRETPLRWLLSNTATTWALYLSLTLVLLYMLFRSKREQRAVPVVEPLQNSSREFVHTIGNLYYNKGDHADLARKMIAYFKEDLRQRTYLRRFAYDPATYAHLSTKLALPVEEVQACFTRLAAIEGATRITEEQLLALNHELGALRARL